MVNREDPSVHLESIQINGFRSCKETTFIPNPDLTALIGINGSGKTNVLQAIRLLDLQRNRSNRRASDSSASGIMRITAWFKVNSARIGLRLTLSTQETVRRSNEFVAVEEVWNLGSLTGSKAWRQLPPIGLLTENIKFSDGENSFFLYAEEHESLAYRHSFFKKDDLSILENPAVVDALTAISRFRSGISYYSASQFTDPSRCPTSFEVNEEGRLTDAFNPSGGAHLKFLHNLYSLRQTNSQLYNEYCKFISRQQLGLISRLTWKEIELSTSTAEVRSSGTVKRIKKRKTLVIPKVQVGTSHITFNQLSEGTFKTLALAFYIITDSSKFLMVEEPEVCVHHGLLRKIVDTIKAYSKRKQTIISTHSDLLVDELEPRHLNVVEMTSTGTSVKGLESWLGKKGREALRTYLDESGPLGEYWRSGGLSS